MSQEETARLAVVELDVSDVKSIRELHQRLSNKLGFPDYYGHNWDAFWDAITGLILMPRKLIVRGWPHVVSQWPKDAEIMLTCLQQLNEQLPSSSCQVELRPSTAHPAT